MLTGTTYHVEINVTSGSPNPLGVVSGCGDTSSTADLVTGATQNEKEGTFELYACAPVADGEVTADLKLDDVVVANATKTVNVRPAVPTNPRANGESDSESSPRVRIRVDNPGYRVEYKVRYELCTLLNNFCANAPGTSALGPFVPTEGSYTNNGQSISFHEFEVDRIVTMDMLYRLEVKAVTPGGAVESDYHDEPLYVLITHERPVVDAHGSAPRIADIPVRFYWASDAYSPKICENSFVDQNNNTLTNYMTEVENGVLTWKNALKWLVSNDSQLVQINLTKGNCPAVDSSTQYFGTTEIRLATNEAEFGAVCRADPAMGQTLGCAKIRGVPNAAGELGAISNAPIFFRDIARKSDWMSQEMYRSCANLVHTAVHEAGPCYRTGAHRQTVFDHAILRGDRRADHERALCAGRP